MQELCDKLEFRLIPLASAIFSDYVMAYLDGKELGEEAMLAKDLMLMSLDEVLEGCKKGHDMLCTTRRAYL